MQTTVTIPVLLDQEAAAKLLGFSTKKLERDRWCEKQIPYVKMGRTVRYRASDLLAYIEGNIVGTAQ